MSIRVPRAEHTQTLQARPRARLDERTSDSAFGGGFGAALQQTARVIGDVAEHERALGDRARLLEADRQLGEWELEEVDRVALSAKGKDAIGIAPRITSEFDKQASRIEMGLSGERQKLAFRAARQGRQQQIRGKLERHERAETDAYRTAETSASLGSSVNAAAANWSDLPRVDQEISKGEEIIRGDGALNGEPQVMTDRRLAMHRSSSHLAVLRAAASAGDYVFGEEYLAGRKDELTANDRLAADELVRQGQVNGNAERILSQFEVSTDQGQEALSAFVESGARPEVRDAVRRRVQEGQSLMRAERRREFVDDIARVDRAIATEDAGEDIEHLAGRLYDMGVYSVDEYSGTLAQIDRSRIAGAKANAGAAEIQAALAAGLPLDPSDKGQRDALASYFAAGTKGLDVGTEPWRSSAIAVANQTRMLPDQALSWTRQAMRSPDPAIAAAGAQFFGAVQAAAPDAISQVDADTKSFASMLNAMIEAGTPKDQAVETARKNVFEVTPATREARAQAWGKSGKDSLALGSSAALTKFLDRDFDPGLFVTQPSATDPRTVRAPGSKQIEPDFTALSEQYFTRTGDIELARELAWSDIRRVYGVSQVNGSPVMMAAPPERFGITPEEVRKDIDTLLAATPQEDGTLAEDVVLTPDALTLRDVGDALRGEMIRPSYLLIGKSGEPVLSADGLPLRYVIPGGEELSKRVRDAQAAAAAAAEEQKRTGRENRAMHLQEQQAKRWAGLR